MTDENDAWRIAMTLRAEQAAEVTAKLPTVFEDMVGLTAGMSRGGQVVVPQQDFSFRATDEHDPELHYQFDIHLDWKGDTQTFTVTRKPVTASEVEEALPSGGA